MLLLCLCVHESECGEVEGEREFKEWIQRVWENLESGLRVIIEVMIVPDWRVMNCYIEDGCVTESGSNLGKLV